MKLILIFISSFLVASCNTNPSKPSIGKDQSYSYSGHLTPDSRPDSIEAQVPQIIRSLPYNPPPVPEKPLALYSISAIEAPVHEVLYRLAAMSNYQVDIWRGVEGNLTINAVNQTLPSILSRIANQLDLIAEVTDSFITIRPDRAYWKSYPIDYVNITRKSQDSIVMNMAVGGAVNPQTGGQAGSRSTIDVVSEHDFWNALNRTLLAMVSDNTLVHAEDGQIQTVSERVVINAEAGLVIVNANEKTHNKVNAYLNAITSRAERQVMIEASVVEVVLSDRYQAGIDWLASSFGNGINATAVGAGTSITTGVTTEIGFGFDLGIKALEEFGEVRVLSSPKIMAINNQPALLKVVDNEVYFTIDVSRSTGTSGVETTTYSSSLRTVPVGLMMSMTPFVTDSNEVTLNVRPTISRIIGRVQDPNPDLRAVGAESLVPVVQEREMETVLRLRNRQTAVIGGLIEDRNDDRSVGLPWLSRIPIIGDAIFGYRDRGITKTELVIFIKPTVVSKPDIEETGDLSGFREFLQKHSKGE
ncbi:type II and III secretion system protein [Thiomicrospira microaerophila]|uniref:type II secretion system protein GspD n=1 Tax=Thiomicrospira microaerophila TaxID=406020 RepID=UPI00201088DF|nr:type II and III secretion system protein [Thiomicrospira microaerophila]UQB43031.1 type II and III secretion system protein [Thiomicrospira microaerophila]